MLRHCWLKDTCKASLHATIRFHKPKGISMRHTPPPPESNDIRAADGSSSFLKRLGPGLITGAADDDPSGIATYSQAGAQFGLGTLWSLCFTYPLMVGIQLISARIGRVTG